MKKYKRVYVEITNICNRNCTFCPGTQRQKRQMTFSEFKTVAQKLQGVTDYLYLHLMGEPLTHKELPKFIEYAAALGFKCAVTTNGTLLGARGDELIRSGVYKVNISLHSFEEGEREEYLDYIDTCCSFADRASSAGVLSIIRLWNRGYDGGRNVDTLRLIREYFPDGEWVEGVNGIRIRNKLHLDFADRFEWPDLLAKDRGERVFCHGLDDHFGVLCDGSIVPCCLDRDGVMTLGNIFESDVSSVLDSERAKTIRRGFSNKQATEELCRRCGYARRFKI